jgi:hypothetical protein
MRMFIALFAAALLTTACQKPEPAPTTPAAEQKPAPAAQPVAKAPTSETAQAVTAGVAKGDKKGEAAPKSINHVVRVIPGDAKVGQEATSIIEITPNAGYKMNIEFPVRVSLTKKDGIKAKPNYGLPDAELTEKVLRFKVPYTAEKAGTIEVEGLADFSVCNPQACKLVRGEQIAWSINAQ